MVVEWAHRCWLQVRGNEHPFSCVSKVLKIFRKPVASFQDFCLWEKKSRAELVFPVQYLHWETLKGKAVWEAWSHSTHKYIPDQGWLERLTQDEMCNSEAQTVPFYHIFSPVSADLPPPHNLTISRQEAGWGSVVQHIPLSVRSWTPSLLPV